MVIRLLAICALLTLGACAYDPVVSDYEPGRDFSQLSSYAWLPEAERRVADPVADNALMGSRVRAAVDQALEARAFRPVSQGAEPSFYVSYMVSMATKVDVQATPAVGGIHPWGGWALANDVWLSEYQALTLVVDVLEPRQKHLIWRGSMEIRFDERSSPEHRAERIRKTVDRILAKFPPGVPAP